MDPLLDGIDLPDQQVAQVLVDVPLPHLDRLFDYLVPPEFTDEVRVGCRVTVRFAGKKVAGFVIALTTRSQHEGRLAPLASVVSSEPVLTGEVWRLVEAMAARYAGTRADVVRLAVPPRTARAEAHPRQPPDETVPELDAVAWPRHAHGAEFIDAVARGLAPRVVFDAVPGAEPERLIAEAVEATARSGRGAIVCVPDATTAERLSADLERIWGPGHHVLLTSAQKPAARYRAFVEVARGEKRIVIGTRGAAWAPVARLGLVVICDDGSDLHAEQRAPYPHAREVLLTRAIHEDTAVVVLSHARTIEATSLVRQGWCRAIGPDPVTRRRAWPQVEVTDGAERGAAPVRLPPTVFAAIRDTSGPVLVQVPRQGYRSVLSCQQCRARARCRHCDGPLAQDAAGAAVRCRWCDRTEQPWACRECGGRQLRSPVVGQLRTAEEFARAFADRTVLTSGGSSVLTEVDPGPVIVLATPGAEPLVAGGYACVVLLDTWLMLARDDIRVVAESHRRWFGALALAARGARAVAVGDSAALQALVRADPVQVAERELDDRAETHLPPIGRLGVVDGPDADVAALRNHPWPPHTEVLGPVVAPDGRSRLILRCPRTEGLDLAASLHAVAAARSSAKEPPLRIQIDPVSF